MGHQGGSPKEPREDHPKLVDLQEQRPDTGKTLVFLRFKGVHAVEGEGQKWDEESGLGPDGPGV